MIKRIRTRLLPQFDQQAHKERLGSVTTTSGKTVNVSRITANDGQDSFLLSSPTGRGGFCKVRAARKDGQEYVAKVVYLKEGSVPTKLADGLAKISVTSRKKVAHERDIMKLAKSPLAFSHIFLHADKAYCFIEKSMAGDMLGLAQRPPENNALQAKIALHIITQIGAGLRVAHEEGIYHSDLKLENYLWNGKAEVLLADFGESTNTRREPVKFGGTPSHGAPEKLLDGEPTLRSDVWALGISALNFLYGNDHPLSLHGGPKEKILRLGGYRLWRNFGVDQGRMWQKFSRRLESDFGESGRFIFDGLLAARPESRLRAGAAAADAEALLAKAGGRADVYRYFAERANEVKGSGMGQGHAALRLFEEQESTGTA